MTIIELQSEVIMDLCKALQDMARTNNDVFSEVYCLKAIKSAETEMKQALAMKEKA